MNIRRLFPSLPLAGTIVVFWLLMVSEISWGQFVMALLLALVIPFFAARLDREFARIGSLRGVPRLLGVLVLDVVMSSIEVARRVLGRESDIHPGFIWYPLDIDNIHGIAALTTFITMTPGTLTAVLSDDRKYLLVHVFDLGDVDTLIADIKRRYEVPLMEIFP